MTSHFNNDHIYLKLIDPLALADYHLKKNHTVLENNFPFFFTFYSIPSFFDFDCLVLFILLIFSETLYIHRPILFLFFYQLFLIGAGPILYHHRYIGYGMFACIAEVNSPFLHARMLMLMYGVPKASLVYNINNTFNMCTFVVLRLCNFFILIPLVLEDCDFASLFSCFSCFFIMSCSLAVFGVNIIVFYRLVKSDLISTDRNQADSDSDIMYESNKKS